MSTIVIQFNMIKFEIVYFGKVKKNAAPEEDGGVVFTARSPLGYEPY